MPFLGPLDQGVYPARTYRKNTWVLGISWVLGVPISDVPSQFLYG
jgi:hypothetical protein